MASIPIQITGVLTYAGLEVGGGPMPGGPFPSHPISPGGPPPHVEHPIPPGVWPTPPGSKPPGIWGGPGGLPPWVMPPIAPGGKPPGIWGGGNEPFPTPPIYIGPPTEEPPPGNITWHSAWSQTTGWIVVGVPEDPHPVPSQGGAT
jgi:hypothetical protein